MISTPEKKARRRHHRVVWGVPSPVKKLEKKMVWIICQSCRGSFEIDSRNISFSIYRNNWCPKCHKEHKKSVRARREYYGGSI